MTTQEGSMTKEVAALKTTILAAFTPGDWLSSADIKSITTLEKIGYPLDRLVREGKLIARGATTGREWALPGSKNGRRAPPAAEPEGDQVDAPDPEDFIAAMATGKRMVVVRGAEHLILTEQETQQVADLIFENFEAGT